MTVGNELATAALLFQGIRVVVDATAVHSGPASLLGTPKASFVLPIHPYEHHHMTDLIGTVFARPEKQGPRPEPREERRFGFASSRTPQLAALSHAIRLLVSGPRKSDANFA